jgi:hypothetical protein
MVDKATPLEFWPVADWGPVVAIMGSVPRADPEATTDPQALHQAAQLATEIALRWGKSWQRTVGQAVRPESPGTSGSTT